jgi:hypothetical protein
MTLGPAGGDPAALAQALVQTALASNAPRIYANGLGLAVTGSDVLMTLWHNGAAAAIINLAFPTAKSLVIDLGIVLQDIEAGVERMIPTPKEIQDGMARVQQTKASTPPSASE